MAPMSLPGNKIKTHPKLFATGIPVLIRLERNPEEGLMKFALL
jgi:hypothetical protein